MDLIKSISDGMISIGRGIVNLPSNIKKYVEEKQARRMAEPMKPIDPFEGFNDGEKPKVEKRVSFSNVLTTAVPKEINEQASIATYRKSLEKHAQPLKSDSRIPEKKVEQATVSADQILTPEELDDLLAELELKESLTEQGVTLEGKEASVEDPRISGLKEENVYLKEKGEQLLDLIKEYMRDKQPVPLPLRKDYVETKAQYLKNELEIDGSELNSVMRNLEQVRKKEGDVRELVDQGLNIRSKMNSNFIELKKLYVQPEKEQPVKEETVGSDKSALEDEYDLMMAQYKKEHVAEEEKAEVVVEPELKPEVKDDGPRTPPKKISGQEQLQNQRSMFDRLRERLVAEEPALKSNLKSLESTKPPPEANEKTDQSQANKKSPALDEGFQKLKQGLIDQQALLNAQQVQQRGNQKATVTSLAPSKEPVSNLGNKEPVDFQNAFKAAVDRLNSQKAIVDGFKAQISSGSKAEVLLAGYKNANLRLDETKKMLGKLHQELEAKIDDLSDEIISQLEKESTPETLNSLAQEQNALENKYEEYVAIQNEFREYMQ